MMSLDDFSSLSEAEQDLILNSPALQPPDGVIPDFLNPPNNNGLANFVNTICLIVTTLAVFTRAYSRIFCVRKVEIEDVLAFGVFGTFVGSIYCNYRTMETGGTFVHQWDVQVKDMSKFLYMFHVGVNLDVVTIVALKASILLEWPRLFVPTGTRNYFYWICRVALIIHVISHSSWLFVENLSCIPHEKIWDMTVSSGSCIDIKVLYIPAGVLNLLSDVIILVLPQKIIWQLQMSSKNKIGISLIFAVGILACVAAAFRIEKSIKFVQSKDNLYTSSGMYLWMLAEQTSLFIVFCAPAAPKAFMTTGPRRRRLVAFLKPWVKPAVRFAPSEPLPDSDSKLPKTMFTKTGGNGISLTQVRSSRLSISESIEQLHRGDLEMGILCTTQVVVKITPNEDGRNGGLK